MAKPARSGTELLSGSALASDIRIVRIIPWTPNDYESSLKVGFAEDGSLSD
jgi:hypothetical protein